MYILVVCTSYVLSLQRFIFRLWERLETQFFPTLLSAKRFDPGGSSSMTDVGLQGVFIYRHLFPPFSITSSVMSSVTSFPGEGEMKGVFIKKGFQPLLSTIP